MYAFNSSDIEGEKINKTDKELKIKEVRLSENILIKGYCEYMDMDFEDNMLVTDIIKVMLSANEKKSRQQVEGMEFNSENYIPWFSTPGMMKKEDQDTQSKCEFYFIKKDLMQFTKRFEALISLNKLINYKGKKIAINKDVIARIALATSSTFETDIEPKIIILPECRHEVVSDIVTIIDRKAIEITEQTEDEELRKHRHVNITAFDGCGIMSLKLADKIKEAIGLNYDVSFAGIRMYNGLAIKGLVTSVDFTSYFEEFYTGDTENFRKRNGRFEIKDMYDVWQEVTEDSLILNETQCKWAKHFKKQEDKSIWGIQEVNGKLNIIKNSEKYSKYGDLLSHLYITKVNKPDSQSNQYTLTNYQLLSN